MNKLAALVEKAKKSSFYLWLLNTVLLRTVPFNKPHGLKLVSLGDGEITIMARNKRSNQNHIKSIHACMLATLCEYACGLSLTLQLPANEYRIILKSINMTYHYQAKMDVLAKFKLSKEDVERTILTPLKTQDAIFGEYAVEVYDTANNHICTGLINWQVKAWNKTKTAA
jgi:acyl-coenzyme A thioesterase PaaI-like protein